MFFSVFQRQTTKSDSWFTISICLTFEMQIEIANMNLDKIRLVRAVSTWLSQNHRVKLKTQLGHISVRLLTQLR